MKGLITSACIFAALSLVSCDGSSRLAKDIQGSWSGTPENFMDNSVASTTILETYDFAAPENGGKTGSITIAGMLTISTQVLADTGIEQPLTLTASARSTISGTWTAIDDDEITVALDPATLNVMVDPDQIVAEGNMIGTQTPEIETMRPSVAQAVTSNMKRALEVRYSSIRHLDDVKVKGTLLKFEIGNMDCVFTRQGTPQ
ncbi:MAG: hypothetical protein K2G41_00980 [Duncaniella sp.]|uniref:hypothetical protein n=1 Tax=Duncaniella sp. TaxID=2518496 RepID=UPI0023D6BB82|nr:hypothetical protein [Duncaniella sp.]MDE6089250.1 hypothetical protein [Duncaniella sp.]